MGSEAQTDVYRDLRRRHFRAKKRLNVQFNLLSGARPQVLRCY